jgi:hypothetical protein
VTSCDGSGRVHDNTAIPDRNREQAPPATADTGVIVVCGQKIALGRAHAGQTPAIAVSGTTRAVKLDDDEIRVVSRTTTAPVRNIKAGRLWTALSFLGSVPAITWDENVEPHLGH